MTSRRTFLFSVLPAVAGLGLLASTKPFAATPAAVLETDPQAAALGYKADTAKVDKAKFPKHAVTQRCSNCILYKGKATDIGGACAIFPGKTVAAKAWCSAYAVKA